MKILAINPGGTSTKISVFNNKEEVLKVNISHTQGDLENFKNVFQQFEYRKNLIISTLIENEFPLESLNCVVGRGGLMKPIPGGTYVINDRMIDDLKAAINGEHPSNLGAALAKNIGDIVGVPSYVVDPVSVDEFQEVSRITGLSDIVKASWLHSLNHKAVCRKTAEEMGGKYEDFNFIVAHLGSGISIVAHDKGKMVDGSGGRSDGPFSPERSGGLPTYDLIKLCYSGKYSYKEMVDKVSNIGGMYDYLGTKDLMEIEKQAENNDVKSKLILDAFIYKVAKEISMYGATLNGKVNKIILTGGISNSKYITQEIIKRVSYLAPVVIIPGEMEMEALALGAYRVINKLEQAKIYV
ncbi:MAG: butyrate kinase [Sedimentibacter sp.]